MQQFSQSTAMLRSLITLLSVFVGDIILRHLMRPNWPRVRARGVFHALHHIGLERVSFLQQLGHTFRICVFNIGQSLQISR